MYLLGRGPNAKDYGRPSWRGRGGGQAMPTEQMRSAQAKGILKSGGQPKGIKSGIYKKAP